MKTTIHWPDDARLARIREVADTIRGMLGGEALVVYAGHGQIDIHVTGCERQRSTDEPVVMTGGDGAA